MRSRWRACAGRFSPKARAGALAVWLATLPAVCFAQTPSVAADPTGAARYLQDLTLTDQTGRQVDLYRDLMAGHTVVLHSFFSHCGDSCPVVITTLQALGKRLGAARMDHEVRFLSLSVDPGRDDPQTLADFAERIEAGPGWYFLTGSAAQVNAALRRIGQYTGDPASHMNLLIAGNPRTGLWKKIHGLAPLPEVVDLLLGVVDDPGVPR